MTTGHELISTVRLDELLELDEQGRLSTGELDVHELAMLLHEVRELRAPFSIHALQQRDLQRKETEGSARLALAEDLDFDPSYRRQRAAASALLGIAINMARGAGHMREPREPADRLKQVDFVEKLAVQFGIIHFDGYHHAPLCAANHWHKQRMPTGPCTCGAERAGLLSRSAR